MKTIVMTVSILFSVQSFTKTNKSDVGMLKDYHMKLAKKKGKMVGVWNMFINQAKKQNKSALQSILHASTAHFDGYYLSTYKYDLYEVFNADPKFFLAQGKKYFKDNGICNMYWLLLTTGEIESKRVLRNLQGYKLNKDLNLAKKYLTLNDKQRNKQTKHCYKVITKKSKK